MHGLFNPIARKATIGAISCLFEHFRQNVMPKVCASSNQIKYLDGRCSIPGSGIRDSGFGFQVPRFGFRVYLHRRARRLVPGVRVSGSLSHTDTQTHTLSLSHTAALGVSPRSAASPSTLSSEPHGCVGFGVWGLEFRVWGLGFGVWGLGFRV